jgi:dienelactone hydrolase
MFRRDFLAGLLPATVAERFASIRTMDDWRKRRAHILAAMQSVMGPLPGNERRCPLDMRVEEETDAGSHIRKLVSYASEPGNRVPAYLLFPKRAVRGGVLCLHPTDDKVGHKVVVGPGGRANRQYASELADRGYIALAPAYPLLANYRPNWREMGYRSGTMKAIWDNIRGLDLLESVSGRKRFGAIGHSLGGHNAVYTAAFEPRIHAIVSSCGLDSYMDYKDGDISGWTSDRYMPALLEYKDRLHELPFDFHDIVATLAPRVCFISAPLGDTNFKWQSVDSVVEAARRIYRLYGKPDNLIVKHPDAGHDFPDDMRQLAYGLLDRTL